MACTMLFVIKFNILPFSMSTDHEVAGSILVTFTILNVD